MNDERGRLLGLSLDLASILATYSSLAVLMEITNQTKKPLSIPLPGGKKLFLGPGKSGQINWKATERPAVQKLVESGEVKVSQDGKKRSDLKGVGRIDTNAPSYTGSCYSDH